jgi:hypothetical protein
MTRAELSTRAVSALVRDAGDHPSGEVDSWIRRATQRVNSELRVAEMVTTTEIPLAGRFVTVPDDFLHATDVRLGSRGPLIYTPPASMAAYAAKYTLANEVPGYFTTRGKQLEITPWAFSPDTYKVELSYFAKIPPLGDASDTTNWLLQDHEDLFLNAVLIYGHRFWMEDDRALLKDGLVAQEIARLNDAYQNAKYGDGPLVMTPPRKLGGRRS